MTCTVPQIKLKSSLFSTQPTTKVSIKSSMRFFSKPSQNKILKPKIPTCKFRRNSSRCRLQISRNKFSNQIKICTNKFKHLVAGRNKLIKMLECNHHSKYFNRLMPVNILVNSKVLYTSQISRFKTIIS